LKIANIDRILPELGYVKGNVAVMSFRANSLKRDGYLKEFKLLVSWLEEQELRRIGSAATAAV
jgi:hypothetical protein